ncbi:MAG: bifunctional 4-hydroxy-2-oxoglutarate aldolase/2-dehydro-3-deoxy-phosphogluconate aldolase, partial [Deltaproteobacteria bacterium]|nr:bifunctional 4-hydroxy-2-oxoglutarate aldolase/2-dehydro-3-deoxy-phosphogluconate aldolase [Deltaproteobacteria bacterium]
MNLHNNQEILRILAIFRGVDLQQAMDAAAVFVDAGIKAIEITCNTSDVIPIIAGLSEKYGEQLAIGAGTVMTVEEVESAKRAGASFILSPDCNPEIIKATKDAGLFSVPGAFTASE